jgi:hypothetical protein
MIRVPILLGLLVWAAGLSGQTRVTFTLDVEPLVKQGFFPTSENKRVFIRGGFNDWAGTSHELFPLAGTGLFQATFELPGNPGDTVAYKYVIQNGPDRFFWEYNPNPSNPDHGNRLVVLEKKSLKLPVSQFSYNEFYFWPVIFSREKLQKDFQQFRSILEETHPALYDYTSKQIMDSVFDANADRIDRDLDFDTFLMLMTEVIAKVGCGHSSLWIPGDYWSIAPQRLFPLDIQISGDRVFVTGDFSGASEVALGSQILKINGEPVEPMVDRLRSLTSADGFNPSYRKAMVEKNFAGKYARAYGQPEEFLVRYKAPGNTKVNEASLKPVNLAQINQSRPSQNELSLKEVDDGRTALLTINSFGYYGEVDMFRTFLDSVFRIIDQKQIHRLVLDLRGNSGGDPFCASYLWAYLQPMPLPYFEDHYGRYDTLANPVPMAPRPYQGNLYTLIDGRCFSTTGHFVGLLKYHGVGKFVGTESGATYTCTGNATYPALDETGIMVGTARVMRYTAAVTDMDPRRGVIPDYPVEPSQQDMINGRDVVLEYALSLARTE